MERRQFLKGLLATPAIAVVNVEAEELPCHEWEIKEYGQFGIFPLRYVGRDQIIVPPITIEEWKRDLIECQVCGEYYINHFREKKDARKAFFGGVTLPGFDVVPRGGQFILPISETTRVWVNGSEKSVVYDNNTNIFQPYFFNNTPRVRMEFIILETKITTRADSYNKYIIHEDIWGHHGRLENGKHVTFSNDRPIFDTLPKHKAEGETVILEFPEWWMKEHDLI